jgi:hypothetical protein
VDNIRRGAGFLNAADHGAVTAVPRTVRQEGQTAAGHRRPPVHLEKYPIRHQRLAQSHTAGSNWHFTPTLTTMSRTAHILLASTLLVLASASRNAQAQTAADSAAIRGAALDYIEGWYEGSGERMERALHPELAKRIVNTNPNGRNSLGQQSAMTLVMGTRNGGGKNTPANQQRKDVRILDIFGNTASVRVDAASWVDYLHVAKWNGRWVIVNVLWELRPQ